MAKAPLKTTKNPEELIKKKVKPKERMVLEDNDRMTITGFIHYEHIGDRPLSVPLNGSILVESRHQPVVRRLSIDKPMKLDTQWIPKDEVGLIVIENRSGRGFLLNPNEQEKKTLAKQVLIINKIQRLAPNMPPVWIDPVDVSEIVVKPAFEIPVPINLYIFGK